MAFALAVALAAGPFAATLAAATPCGPDYAVSGGHFYAQTGRDTGLGYTVVDDSEARFWSAFADAGGLSKLGFPVSNRFWFKGLVSQAFQKAILQWDSMGNRVSYLNTLDELHLAGKDVLLGVIRQTPPHVALTEDAGLNPVVPEDFAKISANHLRLLDQNSVIGTEFLSERSWLELFGLPISYADFGPVQVLRAQRQVFQVWTVDGGGGPKGQAVLANTGDLAKEFELVPAEAAQPVAPPDGAAATAQVLLGAPSVSQGGVLVVRIADAAGQANVALGSVIVPAVCDGSSLVALLPVSSVADTGPATVSVTISGDQGAQTVEAPLTVLPTVYPSEHLTLTQETEQLLAPEIVEPERALLDSIFTVFSIDRRWDGAFQLPMVGRQTSPFGERRIYGDTGLFDYHRGLDIAGPIGTPIVAGQRGVVAWSGPLKVRGNTVIIDHGRGVFSAYFHLAAIDVVAGDLVSAGQRIGAAGTTGLSTGPHLHWEMRILNVPVDPLQWTRTGFLTG